MFRPLVRSRSTEIDIGLDRGGVRSSFFCGILVGSRVRGQAPRSVSTRASSSSPPSPTSASLLRAGFVRGLERTLALSRAVVSSKQRGCIRPAVRRIRAAEPRPWNSPVGIPDELVERFRFPFHRMQPAVQGLLETPCGIAQREDRPSAAALGIMKSRGGW